MTKSPKHSAFASRCRFYFPVFVVSLFCVLTMLGVQLAVAQTYTVLHNFNGLDGAYPQAGLTMAGVGNLYGTGYQGGEYGWGSVFRLRWSGSAWVFSDIYNFQGGNDGYYPISRLIVGPNSSLYSTTLGGGGGFCNGDGCGTFFKLQPPLTPCKTARCDWTKTILYRFTDFHGERNPNGDLLFDSSGNVYGTCRTGGQFGLGEIYELTSSGGDWTVSDLHDFTFGSDGQPPWSGLISDSAGNLYGTTVGGGDVGFGTVFELTPTGSGWVLTVLHAFQGAFDGGGPIGGVIFDQSGNLYGTTSSGGSGGGGTVFELTPSGTGWTFNLLHSFHGSSGPAANLSWDGAGSLYGTTAGDGAYQHGSVFKLTLTNGGWSETDLYSFTGGSDGSTPMSNVTLDANGNLYGTTSLGGTNFCEFQNCGVVWEITP
jgi:uncharacterized repeat protein (TIGR03803 family)